MTPATCVALAEVLRARRCELGQTLANIARKAACTKSYLSALENSTRSAPTDEVLARLEVALDLPPGMLRDRARLERAIALGGEPLARDLQLLARYRTLVGTLREQMHKLPHAYTPDTVLQSLLDVESPRPAPGPALCEKESVQWPFCSVKSPRHALTLRLKSDHMEPELLAGDLLGFGPMQEPRSGIGGLVLLLPRHQCVFARVYLERAKGREFVRMQPLNPSYAPITVARARMECFRPLTSITRCVEPGCEKIGVFQKGRQQPLSP